MYERKFSITAGWLVRGQIRRTVKSLAFDRGFECEVEQDGSLLMFRLRGPDDGKLAAFVTGLSWALD